MQKIGITEFSDPVFYKSWEKWALEKREPTILITKNFTELIKQYPLLLVQKNILIHVTITGYGTSFIEPGVPNPQHIVDMLRCNIYKERVVIRIDPIIPIEPFISQSKQIYDYCKNLRYKRFRISIMDLYPHVLKRMEKDINSPDFIYRLKHAYAYDPLIEHNHMMHAPLSLRKPVLDLFPDAEICGEPGIKCSGCLSRDDLKLMGIEPEFRYNKSSQREFCNCLGIKKELCKSGTCKHNCIYCYMLRNYESQ
jgi:DNA repair photolyase